MASDIMSLFGMDPNVIQQNRVQQGVDNASRMSADYAIGAASGGLAAAGINSAFGLQTPDMAQAQSVKDGMQGTDLNTPEGMRGAAQQLMMSGDYAQAMALHSRANEMEAAGTEATRSTEDRALGKPRNVIITPASSNPVTGNTTPAVTHSITEYPDGRIADATQGMEFNSYAEWMASLRGGRKTPAGSGGSGNLVWNRTTGQWVDERAVEELTPVLSEDQQSTIEQLEERLKITPADSPQAEQIQAAIDNINVAGEEAAKEGLPKKKKQIAYHVKTIEDSRKLISTFTKSDGTIMGTASVGKAQVNLRNALNQIYNLTGVDYSPEDYPVETTEK